jgi:hypothetical protein
MSSTLAQWNDMIQRDFPPTVLRGKPVNIHTADTTDPAMSIEYLGVIDYLSLGHD